VKQLLLFVIGQFYYRRLSVLMLCELCSFDLVIFPKLDRSKTKNIPQ